MGCPKLTISNCSIKGKMLFCKAIKLYSLLSDIHIKAYVTFLVSVLKKITDVNKMFQSDQVDTLKLMAELYSLLQYYLGLLVPPDRLKKVRREDLIVFNFDDCIMNIGWYSFWLWF